MQITCSLSPVFPPRFRSREPRETIEKIVTSSFRYQVLYCIRAACCVNFVTVSHYNIAFRPLLPKKTSYWQRKISVTWYFINATSASLKKFIALCITSRQHESCPRLYLRPTVIQQAVLIITYSLFVI